MATTSLSSPVTPDILQSGDQSLGYNLFPQAQQQIQNPDLQGANARLDAATRGQYVYQDPNLATSDRALLDSASRQQSASNFSNVPLQSQAGSAALLASQIQRAQQVTGGSSINPLSFVTNNPRAYADNQQQNLAMRSSGQQGPDAPLPSGVTAQAATPQSLLQNPQFSAILQKDPQQASNLFRAYTGQDLGQAIQQSHDTFSAQNKNDLDFLNDKTKGNNLTYEGGLPVIREPGLIPGQFTYMRVNDPDPNHRLSIPTALQALNPYALKAAGIPVTPDKSYMYRVLTYQNQGIPTDQAAAMAKQDAINGGQAATAQSLQQQPAATQQQQPQVAPQQIDPQQQIIQDRQNLGAISNSIDEKLNYGSGIAANTLSGMGQTMQNIPINMLNNINRGTNVVGSYFGLQPRNNIATSQPNQALINIASQPSATIARRLAGGYALQPKVVLNR